MRRVLNEKSTRLDLRAFPCFSQLVTPGQVVRASLEVAADIVRRAPDAGAYVARLVGQAMKAPSATRTGVVVDLIKDDGAFAALEHEWRSLHDRSGARSPFTTWVWLYGWWMEIGRPAGYELCLCTARLSGLLVGIGAFYVAEERFGTRVLHNIGDTLVGSEYLDVLCDPQFSQLVIGAIADAISSADDIDAARLLDLDEDSQFVAALRRGHPGILDLRCTIDERLPYLALGGSFERYTEKLSSNMRYNLKRKEKKLIKTYPEARVSLLEREEDVPEVLDLLFRLHARRWQSKGQSGNFVRREVRAFHRRVAPKLLETGRLRLYRLEMEPGRVASMLYCLRTGGREFYLQAGMDPAYEDVAAGFCLMKRVIERCADEGLTEFDMLRGTEGYKSHWASCEHRTHTLRFARRTAKGALWASRETLRDELKGIVANRMPDEVLAGLRGWRERAVKSALPDAPQE